MTEGEELGEATDRMNAAIRAVEEVLCSLHLGVPAEVDLGEGQTLAFRKDGKAFRLFFVQADGTAMLLHSAPRAVRLRAVPKLAELYERMHLVAADETARVRAAERDAMALVDRINAERGNR